MDPRPNLKFQRIGKKGGSWSGAQSPRKAAALEALFARRRGKRVNDPGRLIEIMQIVERVTRVQLQPGRISLRALANYIGVSDRTIRRWLSGHDWPDFENVRKIRRWLRHINHQVARAERSKR